MDKSTTSAERMKTLHKKKENRNIKNERKKERYHAEEKELTEEEHDKKGNMILLMARKISQKSKQTKNSTQGMKLKDKNRKRKQRSLFH